MWMTTGNPWLFNNRLDRLVRKVAVDPLTTEAEP